MAANDCSLAKQIPMILEGGKTAMEVVEWTESHQAAERKHNLNKSKCPTII